MTASRPSRCWPLGVALALLTSAAFGGQIVSMEKLLDQLSAVDTLLEDIQHAHSEEDLSALRERLVALEWELQHTNTAPRRARRNAQLEALEEALAALDGDVRDLREELTHFFPAARNRVAVFTLDDPDGLGVGDDLSFLLAKALLFSAEAQSVAVVNFQQGAAPKAPGELAYFDKVERLTRDEGYALALWGRLAQARDGVRVTLFAQAFPALDPPRFAQRVRVPSPTGDRWLTAKLSHDRFKLIDIVLPAQVVGRLPAVAEEVRTLRRSRDDGAPAVGQLAEGDAYVVRERRGQSVRLQVRGGPTGWTSVSDPCGPDCRALLQAMYFADDVLGAGPGEALEPPFDTLSEDTRWVYEELSALYALANERYQRATEYAARHRTASDARRAAGLANTAAVARLAERLQSTPWLAGDDVRSQAEELLRLSAYVPEAANNLRVVTEVLAPGNHDVQPWRARTAHQAFLAQRRWALVVGITDYAHLPQRKHGEADARRIAQVLRESGYRVDLLLNPDAEQLRRGLRAHASDAEVVIYASGHLAMTDDQTAALLLPAYAPGAPARTAHVPLSTLAAGAGHRTLVLDAPLTGALHERLPLDSADLLIDVTGDKDTVEIGAGAFAYFLSEGLRAGGTGEGDGVLTLAQLAAQMNRQAARFGVPLQAQALAVRGEAALLAAPRDATVATSTTGTSP